MDATIPAMSAPSIPLGFRFDIRNKAAQSVLEQGNNETEIYGQKAED
jgi:hypothetical protein